MSSVEQNQTTGRILIVEDDAPIIKALQSKLGRLSYRIVLAHDGEEAMSILENTSFDLILLDLVMPKKDGFAVLRWLRAASNITPVMVLTNLGQDQYRQEVQGLGVDTYLVKSDIEIADLVELIRERLGR